MSPFREQRQPCVHFQNTTKKMSPFREQRKQYVHHQSMKGRTANICDDQLFAINEIRNFNLIYIPFVPMVYLKRVFGLTTLRIQIDAILTLKSYVIQSVNFLKVSVK